MQNVKIATSLGLEGSIFEVWWLETSQTSHILNMFCICQVLSISCGWSLYFSNLDLCSRVEHDFKGCPRLQYSLSWSMFLWVVALLLYFSFCLDRNICQWTPPPPKQQKNKGATISHALAQSVCLLVFVDISLIVSCFVSRPIFHSLLFSLNKLLFSKFGGIYIFNYFSFFHSLNHSFLFLPSPLVLCSFYVSLSICTLSLCLTLPYYILATTVVCCNLIADNALSFPLFLFDQLWKPQDRFQPKPWLRDKP